MCILAAFLAKLRAVLHSADEEIAPSASLVELGVDSLVAVEVRSWLLKTLKVDLPVLKLVGGSAVDEICGMVMKKLPEELLTGIGSNEEHVVSPPALTIPPTKLLAREPAASVGTPPAATCSLSNMSSSTYTTGSESFLDGENSREGTSILDIATSPTTARTTVLPSPRLGPVHMSKAIYSKIDSAGLETTIVKTTPISVGQSRFWFLRFLIRDENTFNVALKFRMAGDVRIGDFEKALRIVADRHEALRTNFIENEIQADQAYQKVSARSAVRLERRQVSSVEEVEAAYAELRAHEFDLAYGPLLRLLLVSLSPTSHYLLVNYHHIIIAMASFQILTAELEKAYNGHPLGPPPVQITDFSISQRRAIDEGELAEELEY